MHFTFTCKITYNNKDEPLHFCCTLPDLYSREDIRNNVESFERKRPIFLPNMMQGQEV